MQTRSVKKIVVYSHDTFGLGNVRRMLAITEHLLENIPDLSILLISGSPMIHSFRLPEQRFDYLKLPCIGRTLSGNYISKKLGTNFDELVALRSQIIQAAVSNFSPDVMIVDKKPRGIADELTSTLELIHNSMPATNVILLLRDILDDPQVTRQIWLKNHYFQCIERYYHSILVMGSQVVFDVCQEYSFPKKIAKKVIFCGYINRNQLAVNAKTPLQFSDLNKIKILITVGGGEDGLTPVKHYLNGLKQYVQNTALSSLIVTGPEMSHQHKEEIQNNARFLNDIRIVDFIPDLAAHMQAADLIVSMAGYNTIVEMLAMNKPVIVIPRVKPVKEQLIRAEHMDKLGLLKCIHPDELSPEYLMNEVTAQLGKQKSTLKAIDIIDFGGLNTVTETISSMLASDKEKCCRENLTHKVFNLNELSVEAGCSVFS
ncbi:MAG: glycosyltransferase [Methylococcaceae bacterium]|nr:glycosyltransferase [Methylococcaceae bacterium]